MIRAALLLALLLPVPAFAQGMPDHHPGVAPGAMPHAVPNTVPNAVSGGMPAGMAMPPMGAHGLMQPLEPGQGAFAAIQEIVEYLEADPSTDWSRVDIDALRAHLVDMDLVMLHAAATAEPVAGGMRFVVTGEGPVKAAIQHMLVAHAVALNGTGSWQYEAAKTETGATLTVKVPAEDAVKLKAIGFFGVIARGMHHQLHHLAIAQGKHPMP